MELLFCAVAKSQLCWKQGERTSHSSFCMWITLHDCQGLSIIFWLAPWETSAWRWCTNYPGVWEGKYHIFEMHFRGMYAFPFLQDSVSPEPENHNCNLNSYFNLPLKFARRSCPCISVQKVLTVELTPSSVSGITEPTSQTILWHVLWQVRAHRSKH